MYYYSIPILFFFRKFFLISKAKNYASNILAKLENKKIFPDLILIDGRYRVLCALYCYKFIIKYNFNTVIIVDDYLNRKSYHVLEKLFAFKIIGRFGVFYKFKKIHNIELLIKQFSLDQR